MLLLRRRTESYPKSVIRSQTIVELDPTVAEIISGGPELSNDDVVMPKRQKLIDASPGYGAGETHVEQ
jgi:hypothetical protein